jgi:hypothetical protein
MKKCTFMSAAGAVAVVACSYLVPALTAREQEQRAEQTVTPSPRQPQAQSAVGPGAPVAMPRTPMLSPLTGNMHAELVLGARSEIPFTSQVVKGAPLSTDAVTESTRILADGNRIVSKRVSSLYRDSQGRTRRESLGGQPGVAGADQEQDRIVEISDPVEETKYILRPGAHLAIKIARPGNAVATPTRIGNPSMGAINKLPPQGAVAVLLPMTPADGLSIPRSERAVDLQGRIASSARKPQPTTGTAVPPAISAGSTWEHREESLGTQMIEGVETAGTRSIHTIPAGAIGNDRPLEIVSESWYSPELRMTVRARQSDPRVGETIYRLTNLNRSEPDSRLFQVPADYRIHDSQRVGAAAKPVPNRNRNQ